MTYRSRDSMQSDMSLPDEELLVRIRQHDENAFEELFHRYFVPLCRFVVTFVRSSHVAEEIVQEIFYRVWKNREYLNVQGSSRAYLFSAARNHAINFLRKDRNSRHMVDTVATERRFASIARQFDLPDSTLLHHELVEAFDAALEELPEGQRTVVTLRWHHHMSHAEISETLGISIKGVETQIGRAIKRLRRALVTFR